MKWLFVLAFAPAWLIAGRKPRCSSTLWLMGHDTRWSLRRDVQGRVVSPHALLWHCARCARSLGSTELKTSWGLIARLRRQVPWARQRSKEGRVA